MIIEQIHDKPLAQVSYAVWSKNEIFLVDPGRDPKPYLDFARSHGGKIVAVLETHPHADFASSHKEFMDLHGATIYINPRVGVSYDYKPLDHDDTLLIGDVTVRTLFTPGHSPDHNSYLLIDKEGQQKAVFTGDALFIGDVGRPDLREGAGNIQISRQELAGMMFQTIQDVFSQLDDEVVVYPAHGAGSLCGRQMSEELSGTIGDQKNTNWAFQIKDKNRFIQEFLQGQPFIPKYFPHSVEINRRGLPPFEQSVESVPRIDPGDGLTEGVPVVDTRDTSLFNSDHLPDSINIQGGEGDKFETWLGSIITPGMPFYLTAETEVELTEAIRRTARIGYESYIKGAFVAPETLAATRPDIPINDFKLHPERYTIVDIRNESEVDSEPIFDASLNIPLPELQGRIHEIPVNKPIVIHCAGGYRSAIGSSLVENEIGDWTPVYDLGDRINDFTHNE
ncbi:MAG TPA: MBL fold metallo-hydrolase [Membranihabitans sp.]|nr:MBL fold metallo-hydrolase [Membranihabitans sp.]